MTPFSLFLFITDSFGTPVKEVEYDSFGDILRDSNPAFTIPFGFAGGLYDPDTKLVRFGHCDYMPEIGKWTAKDPIGFAGGDTNLFGYVLNNPVNFIDPDGLTGEKWMFHSSDHGGPHFQQGRQRYDAKTLEPIKHKGKTSPELSKTQIENLKQAKAWAQMFRHFQNLKSGPLLLLFPGQEQMEWYNKSRHQKRANYSSAQGGVYHGNES